MIQQHQKKPEPYPGYAAKIEGEVKSIDEKSLRHYQYQFRLLAAGAILFVAWHITEMAILTWHSPTPDKPAIEAPVE